MSAQDKPETARSIGQYQIIEELVRQPVSTIYLAQRQEEEQQVFLVVLQPTTPEAEEWIGRFHRRLETISQLDHPFVGRIVDSGSTAEQDAFAAITYEEGRFLSESLPQLSTAEAPMDPVAALKLVRQIAEALTVAHPNGIIHPDLRPQNIFIRQDGAPFLIDLVVPIVQQTAVTYQQGTSTKLDYLSPEQLAGKSLSGRSNIFSLGIILYRLLAGHRPKLPVSEWDIFEHKGQPREIPLIEARSGLRPETYEVVNSCLWQKEWSRYETVDKLIQAIDKAIEAEEAGPPPPPPLWIQLWNQHRQRLKIGVPAFIILLLLIVAFLLMRSRQAGNDSPNTPTEAPTTPPADNSSSSLEASGSSTGTSTNLAASATSPSPTNTITSESSTTDEASETAGTATSAVTPEQALPTATGTETATVTATAIVTDTATANSATCVVSPLFGWQQYTIQANDTLSTLAQQTEITVELLREVNCLESNLLSIGQKIWLPPLATPTATATATNTITATSRPPPANPPPQPSSPTEPPLRPSATPPPLP